jgi:hypothetical protein
MDIQNLFEWSSSIACEKNKTQSYICFEYYYCINVDAQWLQLTDDEYILYCFVSMTVFTSLCW